MCWYYRVRYSCGGEVWGERQRRCARCVETEGPASDPPCSTKYSARCLLKPFECPICSGEILLDATGNEEDAGLSWATTHEALILYILPGPGLNPSPMLSDRIQQHCGSNYIEPFLDRLVTLETAHDVRKSTLYGPYRSRFERPDWFFKAQNRVQDRWSCLLRLRRLEANVQPTISQAYKYFAKILCEQCSLDLMHDGEHKPKCPRFDCTLKPGHEGQHSMLDKFRWCDRLNCTRELGHIGPHKMSQPIPNDNWGNSLGMRPLLMTDSRDLTARLRSLAREGRRQLEELNRKVLEGMAGSKALTLHRSFSGVQTNLKQQQKFESGGEGILSRKPNALFLHDPQPSTASSLYDRLDPTSNQIRLFKLEPCRDEDRIKGSFSYAYPETCPSYTALSYAWGDSVAAGTIGMGLNNNLSTDLGVADNLLCFLRVQSRMITEPKLFWIDAICINQRDLRERNHQVGLMKLIYTNADDVYVWLGREADDSELAMRFLSRGGPQPLRPRGSGFYPVWTRQEARALGELCERPYWRRMWIIQEVIHAGKIRVWCGDESADWAAFDNLYRTLKTLDDMSWSTHHRYALAVLQSSALTMVWQRAHWRHPDTPVPTLQTLVEVFQEWKCSDLRDKVYALVGIASAETAVAPDYSRSARQVYFDVIRSDLIHRSNSEEDAYLGPHLGTYLDAYEDVYGLRRGSPTPRLKSNPSHQSIEYTDACEDTYRSRMEPPPPPPPFKSDMIRRSKFCNLLSQLLGLSKADAALDEQNLIDYKLHSADTLVLNMRLDPHAWTCMGKEEE